MLRLSFIALGLLVCSCEPINRYLNQDDDWVGEEIVEGVIRYEIGVDVDLTPSSPE